MTDDKTAILIRALEASGSEREAQLARAILGDPAAAAQPDGAALYRDVGAEDQAKALEAARAAAAAEAAPAGTPPGILTPEQIAAWEREQERPAGSFREQQKRLEQLQQVQDSIAYHAEQR